MPGIRRLGTGNTFRYIGVRGNIIHDRLILARIRSLTIPQFFETYLAPKFKLQPMTRWREGVVFAD
jgi:hypothetical protein